MEKQPNVLLIISDTLRPEYLGCYGNDWIKTPCIDQLSRDSFLFTNFFAASFPTGPARKDIHTGRFTFTYTGWGGQLNQNEVLLANILRKNGYITGLVGDTPAIQTQLLNLGFEENKIIRGQSHNLNPYGEKHALPASLRKLRTPPERLQIILRNAALRRGEEDCYVAQTMRTAHRWIEKRNKEDVPFFLTVDTFDPHEPWDPPSYYIDYYDPDYCGEKLFEPAYEPADYATFEEIRHMRYMYAGEVSLVDRWIEYLLDGLEKMHFKRDTIVILTSDHGFYHGEHNFIGKVLLDRKGNICGRWPLYRTISWIPLLIRIPGMKGTYIDALCQLPDLMPTILDLLGIDIPGRVQGNSLFPMIKKGTGQLRKFAITSLTYVQDENVRCPTSFRSKDYLYIYGGDEWQSELYDLKKDPDENNNIINSAREIAEYFHKEYLRFLKSIDCPSFSLKTREKFNIAKKLEVPYVKLL